MGSELDGDTVVGLIVETKVGLKLESVIVGGLVGLAVELGLTLDGLAVGSETGIELDGRLDVEL